MPKTPSHFLTNKICSSLQHGQHCIGATFLHRYHLKVKIVAQAKSLGKKITSTDAYCQFIRSLNILGCPYKEEIKNTSLSESLQGMESLLTRAQTKYY